MYEYVVLHPGGYIVGVGIVIRMTHTQLLLLFEKIFPRVKWKIPRTSSPEIVSSGLFLSVWCIRRSILPLEWGSFSVPICGSLLDEREVPEQLSQVQETFPLTIRFLEVISGAYSLIFMDNTQTYASPNRQPSVGAIRDEGARAHPYCFPLGQIR